MPKIKKIKKYYFDIFSKKKYFEKQYLIYSQTDFESYNLSIILASRAAFSF